VLGEHELARRLARLTLERLGLAEQDAARWSGQR
jgi:hypothetical protein